MHFCSRNIGDTHNVYHSQAYEPIIADNTLETIDQVLDMVVRRLFWSKQGWMEQFNLGPGVEIWMSNE